VDLVEMMQTRLPPALLLGTALALACGARSASPPSPASSAPVRRDAYLDNVIAARTFEQARTWRRARWRRHRPRRIGSFAALEIGPPDARPSWLA